MTIFHSNLAHSTADASDWIAEKRRELATDNVNRSYEAALALLKWVLTSSLVLHSTALVAAFGAEAFAKVLFAGPVWFFLVGIGVTIFSGLTLAVGSASYAGVMSNALWNGEGLDRDTNDVFDPEASSTMILGAALLGLSIACFLLGTGYSVIAINRQPQVSSANMAKTK